MNDHDWMLKGLIIASGVALAVLLYQLSYGQTIGNGNPQQPAWTTNQGGGNKPCVGLMTPGTSYVMVNDNRGAYTITSWDATAVGHLDMQDNDTADSITVTKNKLGKVTGVTLNQAPLTNLYINVYVGDQTTGCDAHDGNTNGCTLAGTEHYTMSPGTTMPYPWSVVQINPNGLEFEAVVVTASVDRPATCIGNDYVTTEHSNP